MLVVPKYDEELKYQVLANAMYSSNNAGISEEPTQFSYFN